MTRKLVTIAAMTVMLVGSVLAATEAQAVKKQTSCPVMGGPVNTNIYADANGKRVYFCCGGCVETFKKDPAKYIKKLEGEGITLDKAPDANAPKK